MRKSASLSSTIDSIRPRFLAETAQRLGRIRAVRDALDRPGEIEAAVTEICFDAHKTTGIAATLGFTTLGKVAQEVDAALTPLNGRPARGPLPPRLTELVDAMMDEMARVTGPRAGAG
jgi:HPt (histidine-containing phosphotransfer) domain-containing protein